MNNKTTSDSNMKTMAVVFIVVVLAVIAFAVLTMPDQRTTGERIGDAIDELPQGPGEAAEQLRDRTPGERVGDAVEDAGEDIQRRSGQ